MDIQSKPRVVNLPGHRLRTLAAALLGLHPLHEASSSQILASVPAPDLPIRVVCISDTHNHRPKLPPGDVLIHAGDLTEHGSFDEVQTQLIWLSDQTHRYKIVVAGNHDVLLDEAFLEKYPERRYGRRETLEDLDWGNVHYLRDSSITLDFTADNPSNAEHGEAPLTPQYGISAFQYPRHEDVWSGKVPIDADIVVTHGPPKFHLDSSNLHGTGCHYLGREIARVRPRLVVFGHIHASYGTEDMVLDDARQRYEDIMAHWAGWGALGRMAAVILWAKLNAVFQTREKMICKEKITTFVNASVVGGGRNELRNQPVAMQL